MGQGAWDRLEVAPGRVLRAEALEFTFARSSGPGGQNVNKLNTKATLRVELAALGAILPAGALERLCGLAARFVVADAIVLSAQESRSQVENRRACLAKLRALLVQALHRPRPRRPTRPTGGSQRRRLAGKRVVAARKAERRRVHDAE